MKFMVMHKSSVATEAEQVPSQELIANVGALLGGAMEAGTFIDAAGLRSSRHRIRLSLSSGEPAVQKGPYQGSHELPATVVKLKVKSMPEAIEWGTRLAKASGSAELEVGTVTEAWDLGMAPRPEGEVPLNVLVLLKATRETESGAQPSAQSVTELERVVADATKAGVFSGSHSLFPSSRGARIVGAAGARRVVDGPFSESKELIAGFMLMEFGNKAEAVEFARKYADVVGTPEVDVREVA